MAAAVNLAITTVKIIVQTMVVEVMTEAVVAVVTTTM